MPINYIVVPTSNIEYQSWQIRLLIWSTKKVGQKSNIIILNCEDQDRPFDNYEELHENLIHIKLPDWAKEWKQSHDDWGGIPNKYNSLKYLSATNFIQEDDTLLFLDPDMVFTKKVELEPYGDFAIGQRYIHYTKLEGWDIEIKEPIMYPFIVQFRTLKKFVDSYSEFCIKIRLETKRWESEMWGLIYSLSSNGIGTHAIDNLGICSDWQYHNNIPLGNIIHYPNRVVNEHQKMLFFKQSHTFAKDTDYKIAQAITEVDRKLLELVTQQRTDYYYHIKWDLHNEARFYTGEGGYLLFYPWQAGFNNSRMSLELASALAYLLNRVLVLPPRGGIINGHSFEEHHYEDFFNLEDLPIKVISTDRFCKIKNIDQTEEEIRSISTIVNYNQVDSVVNFTELKVPDNFLKGRKELLYSEVFNSSVECVLVDRNLLGTFTQTFYVDNNAELRKVIAKGVRYNNTIMDIAWRLINVLVDLSYYAVHIRRGDFLISRPIVSIDKIFNNVRAVIPEGAHIYIATDEQDKSVFDVFKSVYNISFFDEVLGKAKIDEELHKDYIPLIEQLVCTRGIKFIGNEYSTLSSYIYRLRGYMEDVLDKNYYVNSAADPDTVAFLNDQNYVASWYREYPQIWNFENPTIFISVASYCDTQLFDTLDSIYDNAQDPSRVFVGVHLQDTEETLQELEARGYKNIRLKFTNKDSSLGVVWARNRIREELYNNEDYFLQIDSHSRFKERWDTKIVNSYESQYDPKLIITTYPNHYDVPGYDKKYLTENPRNTPLVIKGRLNDDGVDNRFRARNLSTLGPREFVDTRWVSAGFVFAPREWVNSVTIPENIWYNGEEDFLTFGSFLKGWNIRIMSEALVWHNYDVKVAGTDTPYRTYNTKNISDSAAAQLNQFLLEIPHERTLEELEDYFNVKLNR